MSFIKIINGIKDFFEKHKIKIPFFTAIIGGIMWITGLFSVNRAKKNDSEAKRIFDEATKKYEDSEKETTEILEKLGTLQRDVCETYPRLSSAIQMINKSHKGLFKGVKIHELSKKDLDELVDISNQVKLAIEGAGETGGVALISMAAFGVKVATLGPIALVGGGIICVSGAKLLSTSIKNLRQAYETQKTVEKIIQYHYELRDAAELLYQSMNNLYEVYIVYLTQLEEIATSIVNRKKFTVEEKLIIKNTARIVKLLNRMCKVGLIIKPIKENEIETVNKKEVNRLVMEANELIVTV